MCQFKFSQLIWCQSMHLFIYLLGVLEIKWTSFKSFYLNILILSSIHPWSTSYKASTVHFLDTILQIVQIGFCLESQLDTLKPHFGFQIVPVSCSLEIKHFYHIWGQILVFLLSEQFLRFSYIPRILQSFVNTSIFVVLGVR